MIPGRAMYIRSGKISTGISGSIAVMGIRKMICGCLIPFPIIGHGKQAVPVTQVTWVFSVNQIPTIFLLAAVLKTGPAGQINAGTFGYLELRLSNGARWVSR